MAYFIVGEDHDNPFGAAAMLAQAAPRLATLRPLVGSVVPFILKQTPVRLRVTKAALLASAQATQRRVTAMLPQLRVAALHGLGASTVSDIQDDLDAAYAASRQAAEMASDFSEADVQEMTDQAGYKAYGEAQARLGLPISYGSFGTNAAYTVARQAASAAGIAGADIGDWLKRIPNFKDAVGTQFQNYELMINERLHGNFGQLVDGTRALRDAYRSAGGEVQNLAAAFAQSVESGGMSIVQQVMREKPDWLDQELVGNVWNTVQQAVAAGQAGDVGGIMSAIGGGLLSVAATTGPGAPYVAAAGGAMMIGSMIAHLFSPYADPPEKKAFRIYGEQWGTAKLLYAANDDGAATTGIQRLASDGMVVTADALTGEAMIRPYPDWDGSRRLSSRRWSGATRAVDLFDRRALLANDRVQTWMERGSGITFDGRDDTPAALHAKIDTADPFIKFAGAMDTSPVPNPTGGSADWPVGPAIRYHVDSIWTRPVYRAAYVAAAALGGCPPFASYGYWTPDAGGYYASGSPGDWGDSGFYDTGVGGLIDHSPEIPGRVFDWWIPWAAYWQASEKRLLLIPPRRVPFHLHGFAGSGGTTNDAFRTWLYDGTVKAADVRPDLDPEMNRPRAPVIISGPDSVAIANVPGSAFRSGVVGRPYERAMTLEEFFRDWYGKQYDPAEPRTWFVKDTPVALLPGSIKILRAPLRSFATLRAQVTKSGRRWYASPWTWAAGGLVVAGGGYLAWRAAKKRRG